MEVQQRKLEKENSVGVVILARYSSSRLPGKALKPILGKPVLAYIVERVLQVVDPENVVIATSEEPSDNPIADFANSIGVKCFRGSLNNVSRRFYEAALSLDCDYAVRMNGDNIFLDQQTLLDLIQKSQEGKYQFLSNVKNRTYPKGMSVESVRVNYFAEWLPFIESNEDFKEHVMLYLYQRENEDDHYYLMNKRYPEAAGIQLALDTQEDFDRSSWMINNMVKPHVEYSLEGIMDLYNKYEQRT